MPESSSKISELNGTVMATTRRTYCANKMPWPAGNHRSLERFLDEAERAETIDIVADHPAAATKLAFAPYGLDAATVGTILRYAESQEQGLAFPQAWGRWQEVTDGQFSDVSESAEAFADFAQALSPEHWDTRDGEPVADVLVAFVDAAAAGRAQGTSPREAVDALTGVTTEA